MKEYESMEVMNTTETHIDPESKGDSLLRKKA
jgi:hypothetical protein